MRSEIEKMKKSPLVTIKSRLDFIYLAYAISLGLIILFSFMGVMVDEVNNSLNIYAKEYIVKDGDIMHFRFNV